VGCVCQFFIPSTPIRHRQPGILTAAVLEDSVYCECIADFAHVHPAAVELIYRMKSARRMILITDTVKNAGLPDGEYYENGEKMFLVAAARSYNEAGSLSGGGCVSAMLVKRMAEAGFPVGDAPHHGRAHAVPVARHRPRTHRGRRAARDDGAGTKRESSVHGDRRRGIRKRVGQIPKGEKRPLKHGVSTYSSQQKMDLGAMRLIDTVRAAKEDGFDGIELANIPQPEERRRFSRNVKRLACRCAATARAWTIRWTRRNRRAFWGRKSTGAAYYGSPVSAARTSTGGRSQILSGGEAHRIPARGGGLRRGKRNSTDHRKPRRLFRAVPASGAFVRGGEPSELRASVRHRQFSGRGREIRQSDGRLIPASGSPFEGLLFQGWQGPYPAKGIM
jgi:hypothetical protein